MSSQNISSSEAVTPSKAKIKCKGCGKEVQLLLSHLERTNDSCKDAYDMEALRAEAKQLHKEQMAARKRDLYRNDPNEAPKKRASSREYYKTHTPEKRAASREYYETHSPQKKASMEDYNHKNKEKINLAVKNQNLQGTPAQHNCYICDKAYLTLNGLRRHMKHIHLEEDSIFTCPICDKDIKYKDNLDRHMKEVHGEEKKYACPDCSATYRRKEDLDQHKRQGKHYLDVYCEHCKETLTFRYVAEKDKHFIHIKCDHSYVYATTCQSIVDERIKEANKHDKCFIPPNHAKKEASQKGYYEKNKTDEEKKSASRRLYCQHPEKEEKIKAISVTTEIIQTECGCETHRNINCCSHHKLSHYTYKGFLDCHPFGATCLPGCDDCVNCITTLESYKKDVGILYENKFGCKKMGKYDFTKHEVLEKERFWMRKSELQAWKEATSEWNGEKWERMDGFYNCLFCKKKVNGTTKEEHLLHDKKGFLTCVSIKKENEGPFTPCKHNLCEKCGGKTKKHPWEDRLWLSALNCDCKGWIKLHPESQEHPNNK